jgi:nucleoside recognition membrane protein YjiH
MRQMLAWFIDSSDPGVCISAVIFFSAMVSCIMATRISLKVSHMVILWFERVALTILITTPIAHLLF